MADFKQAIEWLKQGKKVRREYWHETTPWLKLEDGGFIWDSEEFDVAIADVSWFEADDWFCSKDKKIYDRSSKLSFKKATDWRI